MKFRFQFRSTFGSPRLRRLVNLLIKTTESQCQQCLLRELIGNRSWNGQYHSCMDIAYLRVASRTRTRNIVLTVSFAVIDMCSRIYYYLQGNIKSQTGCDPVNGKLIIIKVDITSFKRPMFIEMDSDLPVHIYSGCLSDWISFELVCCDAITWKCSSCVSITKHSWLCVRKLDQDSMASLNNAIQCSRIICYFFSSIQSLVVVKINHSESSLQIKIRPLIGFSLEEL